MPPVNAKKATATAARTGNSAGAAAPVLPNFGAGEAAPLYERVKDRKSVV